MSRFEDPIEEALHQLQERGLEVSRHEEGDYIILIIERYRLPGGWSKSEVRLLIKLPGSFPNGGPDMFWTDPDLTLPGGSVPDRADRLETILGQPWRRFSWHPQRWTPGRDDIQTFLEFINQRLAQRK